MTTTEDLASIAREVGGDRITVESIAKGYQDPHFVEAKPSFILKLQKADLLDRRSAASSRSAGCRRSSSRAATRRSSRAPRATSTRRCRRRFSRFPTGQITRAMGDVHPLGNPHYWMDPENGKRIAKEIADKLSQFRPERPRVLRAAARRLHDSRSTRPRSAGWRMMAPYKGTKVVTYHRSFPNFAERFGLDIVGYVEPRPGIPPTPQHTLDLINEMKRQNVKLVLVEPYFDLKTPKAIGRETGAQVLVMPPSVGGVEGRPRLLQAVRLRHQPARRRDQEERGEVDAGLQSMLAFLAAPFVASLILTGIHAYLGVHVVERGVIFVDLSLAQIAALGATIALLLPICGGDPHAPVVYWISLAFTFIGAFVFSTIRSKRARIPQEAIIGICYAVASAAAILAMSKATSESEHLKDMLVGNILAVSWPEVGKTALLYGAIGAVSLHLPPQVPRDLDGSPEARRRRGIIVKFWDFLFYASFGFVVTSSVSIAGVLLVFCYLIVPSVAAMLYADIDRQAAGDRLVDGDDRVGARRVPVAAARPADRARRLCARSASC